MMKFNLCVMESVKAAVVAEFYFLSEHGRGRRWKSADSKSAKNIAALLDEIETGTDVWLANIRERLTKTFYDIKGRVGRWMKTVSEQGIIY